MSRDSVLARAPLLIAHRGGAGLGPERPAAACLDGARGWAADMRELDVHASADGHCVGIHDSTVDRTTDGSGPVAEKTLAELRELDAGYRFTTDGGRTFPFRDRGITIPTIEEVLEALPDMPITVEVKAAAAQQPLFDAIRRFGATDRVIAAGMYDRNRTMFDTYDGPISGSLEELKPFWLRHRVGLGWLKPPP